MAPIEGVEGGLAVRDALDERIRKLAPKRRSEDFAEVVVIVGEEDPDGIFHLLVGREERAAEGVRARRS